MSDMLSLSEKGSTRLWRVIFGGGRARLAEYFCFEIPCSSCLLAVALDVFVLGNTSPLREKSVFHLRSSVAETLSSASRWQKGFSPYRSIALRRGLLCTFEKKIYEPLPPFNAPMAERLYYFLFSLSD
jgi:hypothetical protein